MFKKILIAFISALLFSLAWLNIPAYSLFFAFVPLFFLQQARGKESKKSRVIPYVAFAFFMWNLMTVYGIAFATVGGMLFAVSFSTALFTGIFAIYHKIWLKAKPALAYTFLVSGWITMEYLYMNAQISWPWLTLGNAFACTTHSIQWYEYTGVFGGSLWVLVANILIFNLLKDKSYRDYRALIAPVAWIAVPIIVSLIQFYTYTDPSTQSTNVSIIQPNIDPYNEKFGGLTQAEQTSIILNLAENAPKNSDYFIAPETAIDGGIWESYINDNPSVKIIEDFLKTDFPKSKFVIGATTRESYPIGECPTYTARFSQTYGFYYDTFNTALQIDTTQNVDIYHKSKLVIGVEMMPCPRLLRKIESSFIDLGGTYGQLGTQPDREVFWGKDSIGVGTAICYESIYGEYLSEFVRNGANVLFIITNDGWWKKTGIHRHHFNYARLRAIELRRWIARSANTGISGVINSRGDIVAKTKWDQRCSLNAPVNIEKGVTFYAKTGDYIARIATLVALLSIIYFVAYSFRKKNHLVE